MQSFNNWLTKSECVENCMECICLVLSEFTDLYKELDIVEGTLED